MTAADVPKALARDLADALAKLKLVRELNPTHEEPSRSKWHPGCDVCLTQRRFDYLTDQMSRVVAS